MRASALTKLDLSIRSSLGEDFTFDLLAMHELTALALAGNEDSSPQRRDRSSSCRSSPGPQLLLGLVEDRRAARISTSEPVRVRLPVEAPDYFHEPEHAE